MKKFFVIALVSFFLAPVGNAVEISKIQFRILTPQEINYNCGYSNSSEYDPIWACYLPKRVGENIGHYIFIRNNIPNSLMPYVLARVIGRALVYEVSFEEKKKYFNPPMMVDRDGLDEIVANSFAMWLYSGGKNVPKAQNDFWKIILSR